MALGVEAAELAEIFMWRHSDDADRGRENPEGERILRNMNICKKSWQMCFGTHAACVSILMWTWRGQWKTKPLKTRGSTL